MMDRFQLYYEPSESRKKYRGKGLGALVSPSDGVGVVLPLLGMVVLGNGAELGVAVEQVGEEDAGSHGDGGLSEEVMSYYVSSFSRVSEEVTSMK